MLSSYAFFAFFSARLRTKRIISTLLFLSAQPIVMLAHHCSLSKLTSSIAIQSPKSVIIFLHSSCAFAIQIAQHLRKENRIFKISNLLLSMWGLIIYFMLFTYETWFFIVLFAWIFLFMLSIHRFFPKFHMVFHNQDINWNFKKYSDAKNWEKPSFFELTIFCFVIYSAFQSGLKTIKKFRLKWRTALTNLMLLLLVRFRGQVACYIPQTLALDKLESRVKLVRYLYWCFEIFFTNIYPILCNNYFTFYESNEILQIVFNRVEASRNPLVSLCLCLFLNWRSICSP